MNECRSSVQCIPIRPAQHLCSRACPRRGRDASALLFFPGQKGQTQHCRLNCTEPRWQSWARREKDRHVSPVHVHSSRKMPAHARLRGNILQTAALAVARASKGTPH
eukprot:13914207-Alexandrium_andersonii.AAC.1